MEPWLTGEVRDLHPLQAALLYSFRHARQDLHRWTANLSPEQMTRRTGDIAPVAFHIRHIAGSVDRLLTYAEGKQLSEEQMEQLRNEDEPGLEGQELLPVLDHALKSAEERVRALDIIQLNTIRDVGRKRVPVPLGVLLAHIAEHTQRHIGAAIVTAKVVSLTP